MEHRYGRHGPRAWLRWRQRRYGRPSLLPVPVVPPTVVHVQVPINAERVIYIIMEEQNTTNDTANTGKRFAVIPAQQGGGDVMESTITDCWLEGRRNGTKAKREGDIPSFSELEDEKLNVAQGYVESHLSKEGINKQIVYTLEASYLEGYCEAFRVSPNDAEQYFQKNQTRVVRQRALRDRAADVRNNIQLSQADVELQGAIRAINELNLSPKSGTYYMQQVKPYVRVYTKYYTGDEGEDSFRRPTS